MKPLSSSNQRLTDLWSSFGSPIRGYILSLTRDATEADDLTQETFLRAIRKLDALKDDSKLSSWLYRIATNICHDRYRQKSRQRDSVSLDTSADEMSESMEPAIADTESPPLDQLLEQSEMSDCVQRYLDELSDSYRAVILLHDLEGMTNDEIAKMLGCSLGSVKIRLHRARAKLKSALQNACAFSTDKRGVLVCEPKPPEIVRLSEIDLKKDCK
jgi:RNA polymerase sigma-70 factor (ECF subfamily)